MKKKDMQSDLAYTHYQIFIQVTHILHNYISINCYSSTIIPLYSTILVKYYFNNTKKNILKYANVINQGRAEIMNRSSAITITL